METQKIVAMASGDQMTIQIKPEAEKISSSDKQLSVLRESQHQPSAGGDMVTAVKLTGTAHAVPGVENMGPSITVESPIGTKATLHAATSNSGPMDELFQNATPREKNTAPSTSTSGSAKGTKRSKGASGTPGQEKKKRAPAKPKKSAIEKLADMTRPSVQAVHAALKECGIDNPQSVNPCLKRGIQIKYVRLDTENPLDKEIFRGDCFLCGETRGATVRDLLYQPVYGGNDYEEAAQEAPVKCMNKGCDFAFECADDDEEWEGGHGLYVTGLCYGNPSYDSGKFHNHCTECPGFGQCIGDYREAHCRRCKGHYFAGGSGFPCPCKKGRGGGRGQADDDCSIQ